MHMTEEFGTREFAGRKIAQGFKAPNDGKKVFLPILERFESAEVYKFVRGSCQSSRGTVFSVATMNPDIRWKQRFQNFDRAYFLLSEALEGGSAALNQLEKEGAIQRFEYSFELAWKTIKDFLEDGGMVFATITPRQVLKDAFAAKMIADGQVWIDMLDHRNLLSHTYNSASFEKAVEAVATRYLPAMKTLHEFFLKESLK